MATEPDDHAEKAFQAEVEDLDGADPEPMILGVNATQEDFDRMWLSGDTVTEDGYLT